MQYLFHEDAGSAQLWIKGEAYKYLFKVRRHSAGDSLCFRDKAQSEVLHTYRVASLEGRAALLELQSSENRAVKASKYLHIAWCVVDPKSVEKVLASLNEMGVAKISFIYCDRSQKNFKSDLARYERITEGSSQQCGRSEEMLFEVYKSLDSFLSAHPETVVLDFCEHVLGCDEAISTVLIGCEGGFSEKERKRLESFKRFRLDTPMILRSESAAVGIASKLLI